MLIFQQIEKKLVEFTIKVKFSDIKKLANFSTNWEKFVEFTTKIEFSDIKKLANFSTN